MYWLRGKSTTSLSFFPSPHPPPPLIRIEVYFNSVLKVKEAIAILYLKQQKLALTFESCAADALANPASVTFWYFTDGSCMKESDWAQPLG